MENIFQTTNQMAIWEFFSTFSETAIDQTSPPHLFILVVWILFDNLFQPGWDFCSSKKL